MSVYKVGFWYTVYGGAIHVEAESKEEAEKWVYDELEQNGLGEGEDTAEFEFRTNDREYGVTDAEKVED